MKRITIEIDDELLKQAMKVSGEATESATVEIALRLFVQMKAQAGVCSLRCWVPWEGDLSAMRESRFLDNES